MRRAFLLLVSITSLPATACREQSTVPSPSVEVAPSAGVRSARVGWPAADRVDRVARSRMPPQAVAGIARASVPVLVPASGALLSGGTLVVEPLFYAFAASIDGMNVSIQGTRGEYASGEVEAFDRADVVRGTPAIVTETDAIWTASWVENGVAYVVSVECSRAEDAHCQGKGYVRELAEQLAYVGGAGEGPR